MKFQHKDLVIDLSILKALQGSVAVLSKNGDVIVLKEKWGDGGLSSNWFDIEPKTDNYNLTTAGMPLSWATILSCTFFLAFLTLYK